jgi:hypothetical protein
MKRTITEIIVEVEETVAVRLKEKSAADENASSSLKGEHPICPVCGQPTGRIIEVEKENRTDETASTGEKHFE